MARVHRTGQNDKLEIMHVRILLFGVLKDRMGRDADAVEVSEGETVGQLLQRMAQRTPHLNEYGASLAIAVNREYATAAHVLRDGDEVALLPPVSGGCAEQVAVEDNGFIRIQREPIDSSAILPRLKDGADGAVSVFDGVVRDNTRGRRTLYLDYEAYEEMALEQMKRLAADAKQRFGVREVAMLHRLGRLQVGETSVWIAVASAHRAQAMDACRWLIDTLKKTVPIWKKEYFVDGAVWADGEPFPPEIAISAPET